MLNLACYEAGAGAVGKLSAAWRQASGSSVTGRAYTVFRGFYETAFKKTAEKRFPGSNPASNALAPATPGNGRGLARSAGGMAEHPAGNPAEKTRLSTAHADASPQTTGDKQ